MILSRHFFSIVKFIFLIAFFLLLSCNKNEEFFESAICIENITLIDAKSGVRPNMTLVIKGNKIFNVFKTEDIKLSKENKIINGSNKYIIPGLWDSHVHIGYDTSLTEHMLSLFLTNGVTSIRDTGGEIGYLKKWKELSLEFQDSLPRIMISGPLIDGIPTVYDGSDPSHPTIGIGIDSEKAVIKMVDSLYDLGVDFIKAYEMLSPEVYKALLDRAKEKGIKVSGHVPLSMDAISISNAGLNSMEHLRNLEFSLIKNPEKLLNERQQILNKNKDKHGDELRWKVYNQQRFNAIRNSDSVQLEVLLNTLKENQTFQVPTLILEKFYANRTFVDTSWQNGFNYLPKAIKLKWKKEISEFVRKEIDSTDFEYSDWMFSLVGKMNSAGVDLMAGTDTPILYLTPGLSLHEELASFVEAGLSELEAIETATWTPAKYFGLDNELGNIEPGMIADLLILDGNPIKNIKNTRNIISVIKNGRMFNREELNILLNRIDNRQN